MALNNMAAGAALDTLASLVRASKGISADSVGYSNFSVVFFKRNRKLNENDTNGQMVLPSTITLTDV